MNPSRVRLMPSSVSCALRILHQDAAMSPGGTTCTPSAPPWPPVHSAPVRTATTVWAPPTAGESYSPDRSLLVNPFFFFFKRSLVHFFYIENGPLHRTAVYEYLYCLYCTVLYCTVLYSTALCCTVLHCTVQYCTALRCTVNPVASSPHVTSVCAAATLSRLLPD